MYVKYRKLPMVAPALLLAASFSLAFASTSTTKPQPANPAAKAQKDSHHAIHHTSKRTRKVRARGQKAIDGERVRQIQEALIREHYLKGEPSGKWDASTQVALHRYQADQGWQSKSIPDSRALIRLGLGPDSEHLLNPESAMTMTAEPTAAHVASRSSASAKSSSAHVSPPAGASTPASSAQVATPSSTMSAVPAR